MGVRRLLVIGPISMALVGLIVIIAIGGASSVRADDPGWVGLVVAHDDEVIKKCVQLEEDETTGLEVLEKAGLDPKSKEDSGKVTVCELDGKGCSDTDNCLCKCEGDSCEYWSYWHMTGGLWRYGAHTAGSYKVKPGTIEGWAWGKGEEGKSGAVPPFLSLEEMCGDELDLPTITKFEADRTKVAAGESATLSWDLHNADGAFLSVGGQEEGVAAPGSKVVQPDKATVYTLIARNGEGEVFKKVTITITAAKPTPVPTDTPKPEPKPKPKPTKTPAPTDTPVPTNTPLPPTATFIPVPASTPTPTFTPTAAPSPTATRTATPGAVAARSTPARVKKPTPSGPRWETPKPFGLSASVLVLPIVGLLVLIAGGIGVAVIVLAVRVTRR